jgi:Zn-dependent oligopeptidase
VNVTKIQRSTRCLTAGALLAAWAVLSPAAPARAGSPGSAAGDGFFYSPEGGAPSFRTRSDTTLAQARKALERLLSVDGTRTIENTLVPYNLAFLHADNVTGEAQLLEETNPDSAYRDTAGTVKRDAIQFLTDLSLNRDVYDALQAVDVSGADADTRFFVERTLRDFRLAGVDRDEATRKRIAALNDSIVAIGQEFERNIRDDSRSIEVSPEELDGLPEDYIRAHPPRPNGKVTLTIEYPDYFPVLSYCKSEAVRKRLFLASSNRAYPQNMEVLNRLLTARYELAQQVGYNTWADYVTADKMIGSKAKAAAFIQRLNDLTLKAAEREYAAYLKRKQEDDPSAKAINIWERRYYGEQIRKRDYDYDAQEARPYFAFDRVKQGVLDVTSRLFGVAYKRIPDAPVWDPSVEAYELYQGDRLLGRFYLDLHPRAGKFSHAANFPIHGGTSGVQLPQGTLVCNFPGGKPDDPGLMEHMDVVTFFHEFGHLLHSIIGGQQRWEPLSGVATERDFVEAPSQLLEEFARDPVVLQTFARNDAGESIPADLVTRMRRADTFGRAVSNSFQVFFAAVSLDLYSRNPKEIDTDRIIEQLEARYQPFPLVPDTHMQASFGHLNGYSAIYYTYQWSLVIAKDFWSQFDPSHPFDPAPAQRYRDTILAPGGSEPAAKLVHSFLGRDFRFDAYERWLSAKN